jgi:hypothetical protein
MYLEEIKSVEQYTGKPFTRLLRRNLRIKKQKADSRESAFCHVLKKRYPAVLLAEVNPDVEPVMIPIRLVVPAPLPVRIHLGDIMVDLPAVLSVFACVAIDFGSICFQPPLAVSLPISVRSRRPAKGK